MYNDRPSHQITDPLQVVVKKAKHRQDWYEKHDQLERVADKNRQQARSRALDGNNARTKQGFTD